MPTTRQRPPVIPTMCLLLALASDNCSAREHLDGFDTSETSWQASFDKESLRLQGHGRTHDICKAGDAAERFVIETKVAVAALELRQSLPPARLIDELELSLWLFASQEGPTLAVRVVLPNQIDPRTGDHLTLVLDGSSLSRVGQWQKLECRELVAKLRKSLPAVRRTLQTETGERMNIDIRGAYADTAILRIQSNRGISQFVIDELRFGPIVDATPVATIQRVDNDEAQRGSDAVFPLARVELGRLVVGNQPYFPRMIPYHGERMSDLARMHSNVVWIRDYRDSSVLDELNQAGLRAMASPPRIAADSSGRRPSDSIHLAPFGPDTEPILFWYLGTRIPADAKQDLTEWGEQIQNADRRLNRPLMGDVAALERTYSRQLKLLGTSRSAMQTSFGMKPLRDWLIERRNLAQPGSFLWTWIQTEPPPSVARQRAAAGLSPLVVEPELLRLQVYGALAAGYRGIGYWTTDSLDTDQPGALERKLMIAQLNMELELLEPWLAIASVSSQTPFTANPGAARNPRQLASPANRSNSAKQREAQLNDREIQLRKRDQLTRDLEAATLRTEFGLLVLPVWYGEDSQYVPGQMSANDAKIVVPGVGEAARAWEISTTQIQSLESEPVAGGRQITLRKFDMTAAILFTRDHAQVERLRAKMQTLAESSARVSLELARAKLQRVAEVHGRLNELGMGQHDASQILASAQRLVDRADADLRASRFHDARLHSADVLQSLRILQYVCWSDAVSRMYSPVSSPHTLCFQTLPDHWDMLARFGKARKPGGKNVLRSGDFEDFDTMVAEGWQHFETAIDGIRSTAELYPRPRPGTGTYSLRLIATPDAGKDPPGPIGERPVSVTTPPLTVYKGQLVYIRGWIKVAAPILGNLDGALVYDSIGGPSAALRWRTPSDWQQFELVRAVQETGDLTLTLALSGLGEVRFDDLQIIPLETQSPSAEGTPATSTGSRPGRTNPFDFFKRLPGFKGKSEPE